VPEGTAAVGEPTPPVAGMESFAERMPGAADLPEIPVDGRGGRLALGKSGDFPAVPAAGRVHVGVDAGDIPDDAGFGPGLELEVVRARVALVAHLSDHAGAAR